MNAHAKRVVHAKGNDERRTPKWLFRQLDREFHFKVDAAATSKNKLCAQHYGPGAKDADRNALRVSRWASSAWLNPPYSKAGKFVEKAAQQAATYGVTTVLLLASRTDTRYWHDHIWDRTRHRPYPGVQLRFWKGRLHFDKEEHGAPFPSVIVVMKGHRA